MERIPPIDPSRFKIREKPPKPPAHLTAEPVQVAQAEPNVESAPIPSFVADNVPEPVFDAPIQSEKKSSKKPWILAGAMVILVGGASIGVWIFKHHSAKTPTVIASPIPPAIPKSVTFKVYYPDQKKLPAGYVFQTSSVSTPVKNGVSYAVTYDSDKKMVFSVQAKPSDNELESFKSNYIPLHIEFQTPLGQALIGAYRGETLVSLPIINGPWIVVTAPPDINQDQLKQVIKSLISN